MLTGFFSGLFFNATVAIHDGSPSISKYGSLRYTVSPRDLTEKCPIMYFTDFYCVKKCHHIQLVSTSPDSAADDFCKRKAIKLDIEHNPFFYKKDGKFFVPSGKGIKINILFTEMINLDCELEPVKLGYERIDNGKGVTKRPDCAICNIQARRNNAQNCEVRP